MAWLLSFAVWRRPNAGWVTRSLSCRRDRLTAACFRKLLVRGKRSSREVLFRF